MLPVIFAQSSSTNPQRPATAQSDDTIVRIDTNLVQIDVVVTDKSGKVVSDLTASDFELFEDKQRQEISNFSYINLEQPATRIPIDTQVKTEIPIDKKSLAREQVQRTIALVVDDLTVPFDSVENMKRELRNFINNQMQPNDLVAITRTSRQLGVLQRFTSDKKLLLASIDQIRAFLPGVGGISGTKDFDANQGETARKIEEIEENSRRKFAVVSSLGTLRSVVLGLRQLPGRKSLLYFSGGLPLTNGLKFNTGPVDSRENSTPGLQGLSSLQGPGEVLLNRIKEVTDLANRASVVFYSIDVRALQTLASGAQDNLASDNLTTFEVVTSLSRDRRTDAFNAQAGLRILADFTGGKFSVGPATGIKSALADQKGYYLLGYQPDEKTFVKTAAGITVPYHQLNVKVKRPGLVVRTRAGFYGLSDEAPRTGLQTPAERLVNAVISPFSSDDLYLKVTPIFNYENKEGKTIKSLLYVDGKALSFKKQEDGRYRADFELLILTFGETGGLIDRVSRTQTAQVDEEAYQRVLREGFAFVLATPVKTAGPYQVKAAIRDIVSDRIGSAGDFVQVPDIKKGKLVLAGLFLDYEKAANTPVSKDDSLLVLTPAVRQFYRGTVMEYLYHIYNPKTENGKPQVETQLKLFKDGQEIYGGNFTPLNLTGQAPVSGKYVNRGRLGLGKELSTGRYVLQLTVKDLVAKKTSVQDIDFEIIAEASK
jgi:VWFA-related protein